MAAEDAAGAGRLLVFRVGRGRYALPLDDVRGIQNLEAGCDPGDSAVFQGRTLPVIDAGALHWGRGPQEPRTAAPVLVIVAAGGEERALAVDGVEGICESPGISEWPALVAPYVRRAFLGVALRPEGDLVVVDPAALCRRAAAQ